ncbi:MAG: efflux RND transporter permease subunit [Planctomycetia bacterium]|nr:efflux RND transporter permease subunit [Planctomycetia bacterium]
MIQSIVAWSLHNRFIVILGALALVGVGLHSASQLNVEAYPDPTPPLVEVISQSPGSSPEEMERLVGIPLETGLNGMPGLKDLRSTSIAGLNDIKCRFHYGTDYVAARQEVLNRIATVDLPPGVAPRLSPWSPTGEIVRYVLEGPGYTTNQLKAVQDWVLNRILKQVPGVIDVTGFGGTVKQYQVLIDPRQLRRFGVTLRQVEDAIERSNANIGGDVITLGGQAHNVRAIGLLGEGIDPLDPALVENAFVLEMEKLEDIKNVVVTSVNGTPVYVRQLAEVIVGHRPRLGIVGRGDEDDVVEGIVLMRKGEKSLATANAVAEKLAQIERDGVLPQGMKVSVFNQRVDLVHVTTHNVVHNLLVGMGLVVAVLFVFLGNIPSAAIVAAAIPLSLLFAVTMLYTQGKSANLLSLGAVDFGIIVDSSVIMVENIYRHLSEHAADKSHSITDKILDAAGELQRPLLFSTLIIVCAFLPLFFMSGPAGALFGPMASTYALAIGGALALAITLAPVLCSFLLRNVGEEKDTLLDSILKGVFGRALRAALAARWVVVAALCGAVVFTLLLALRMGNEFMPQLEEGNLWIRAVIPRTSSFEAAARMVPRLRNVIASIPEVRGVMSQVGRPDDGTDLTGFFNLEFNVPLKPMDTWRKGVTRVSMEQELGEKFADFPGITFGFSQLIRDNIDEALSGVKGANSIKVFGNDLAKLEQVSNDIVRTLRHVPGIVNVGVFRVLGQPNLEIAIDRQACARYGLNVADVESIVQVAIGGRAFSEMVEGEKTYDIVLRLPQDLRDDPDKISRIPIDLPTQADGSPAGTVPLSQVATIAPHAAGASSIYRENNQRFMPIKFAISGRDLGSAIRDAQAAIADPATGVHLPAGYHLEWSGEFAQMQEAFAKLTWLVPLSIGLILLLLHTAFGAFRYALMVMFNVLVAAMGGVWALWLTGTSFSISAAVGFISIFGVAVQNGVLLITYFNALRAQGFSPQESVYRGIMVRLRPVIMTSLTAILGLLPAALATSIGSQAQKPLAIVVVGGMLSAMILPQIILPVLYTYFPAPAPAPPGDRP